MSDGSAPALRYSLAAKISPETAARGEPPLAWRLALPLIGGASLVLWAVIAEAVRAAFA